MHLDLLEKFLGEPHNGTRYRAAVDYLLRFHPKHLDAVALTAIAETIVIGGVRLETHAACWRTVPEA